MVLRTIPVTAAQRTPDTTTSTDQTTGDEPSNPTATPVTEQPTVTSGPTGIAPESGIPWMGLVVGGGVAGLLILAYYRNKNRDPESQGTNSASSQDGETGANTE